MTCTCPIAPDRISSMAFRCSGLYWQRYAIISFTRALWHASTIALQSATLVAIGFSHNTCLPAFAARIVYSACIEFGSAMYTASISLFCRISS